MNNNEKFAKKQESTSISWKKNKKKGGSKRTTLIKEEEGGIEEECFYGFPISAVILFRRTSLFYFLIDGRKKDARTLEKLFKRHLKLSLLII